MVQGCHPSTGPCGPRKAYLVYLFLNIPAAQAKNITTVCTIPVCIPFEIPRGSVGRLEYLGNRYSKTALAYINNL